MKDLLCMNLSIYAIYSYSLFNHYLMYNVGLRMYLYILVAY